MLSPFVVIRNGRVETLSDARDVVIALDPSNRLTVIRFCEEAQSR